MNEKKFSKLFEELQIGHKIFTSDSELAGFAVWFLWIYMNEKLPNNMTRYEIVTQQGEELGFSPDNFEKNLLGIVSKFRGRTIL